MDDTRGETSQATSKRRFEEMLPRRRRPSAGQAGRPRAAPAAAKGRARLATHEASRARDVRGAARTAIEAEARARQASGAEATRDATGRLQGRQRSVLHGEDVSRKPRVPAEHDARQAPVHPAASGEESTAALPVVTAVTPGRGAGPLAELADAGPRAERALAMVEQVELLLRSGRPALSVSLRTRVPSRVEVERVGRATVTLRLATARAPPPEEVALLRTALATRGLRLHALEWIPPRGAAPGPALTSPEE